MPNNLVSFRVEEDKVKAATNICERLGLDLPTYLRLCISRLIKEDGIPFSMKLERPIEFPKDEPEPIQSINDLIPPTSPMVEMPIGNPSGNGDQTHQQLIEQALSACKINAEFTEVKETKAMYSYRYTLAHGGRSISVVKITRAVEDALQPTFCYVSFEGATVIVDIAKEKKGIISRTELHALDGTIKDDRFSFIVGLDHNGKPCSTNFKNMPHLLIGGTTGSGKSIFLHTMLVELLEKNTPDQLRLILVDPKRVEFSLYKDIPNLLCPIIKDPKLVRSAVEQLIDEMDKRYNLFESLELCNIIQYNELYAKENGLKPLPSIMMVIDEYADIVDVDRSIEIALTRLVQKSRSAGIHVVISTQRTRLNVVSGRIRANFPSAIAFRTMDKIDSVVMLGEQGAEKLSGSGDMLASIPDVNKYGLLHLQCPYTTMGEVKDICDTLRQKYKTEYGDKFVNLSPALSEAEQRTEKLYARIKASLQDMDYISTGWIQRNFNVGFPRARQIMERLIKEGLVESNDGSQDPRGSRVVHANKA